MRTLSTSLLAAQKKAGRLPYIEALVYDYEAGIKRLSWTRLYTGAEADNHHGIAFDGQGSMHRIRADGSNLYHQKVATPGPGSDYSTWTLITDTCSGPCAIAASGAKIYIFYRHNELNQLNKLYSHDYGQSWNNAQLVAYADVLSLTACWWVGPDPQSPTPIVVCFALKSNQLNAIILNTSTQATQQTPWSDGTHPLLDTYGIGATYNASLDQCEVVLAGKESDSPYNHYDLFRTKLSNTYNFLALESFLMSPDGEDVTYEYPDCHRPLAPEPYETNRILAVEKFVGTTAYTRPLTCHMVKGTYWSDTTFTEPKPFLDIAPSYGLRLTTDTSYWWLQRPDGVWRAPRAAGDPLVLTTDLPSGRIVALTQQTQATQGTQPTLVLTLDNSQGQYSPPNLLNKLNKRYELALKLGYKTPAGDETSEAGTYWIDAWHYSTSLNECLFHLYCIDGWGLMARWSARYQMRWNKDDVNPRCVWQILYQLLARVGIQLTNEPSKPQSTAINNFYPDFTIQPSTSGLSTINRLLSFVPDQLVFRGQEAFTKDILASESSCYSYSTNPTNPTNSHAILSGEYREAVTLSRARALGRDDSDNRILEEALDWDLIELAIDELGQVYDPNLQTAARAQERADALLRQTSLRAQRGNLVIPTNCGQELYDVVQVTDARCGIDQEKYRILAILTAYDRRVAKYDQILTLEAP